MSHPASASISRYLDACLYLLLLTGFLTLTSTGKLDAGSLLLVSAALVGRGYLLLRGHEFLLSDGLVSTLTLAYVGFYIADLLLLSRGFVPATVHLVLFTMVVRLFSVRRDRDRLFLGILAFLAVLAAAVLTVDSVFLGAFSAFLLLAVAVFMAFEMKRSAQRASMLAPLRAQGLTAPLSATALAMLAGIAVLAGILFFVIPRFSTGYLGAFAPRNELVTGFSDTVRLGQIGDIQQSNQVVMHVQIAGDTHGAYDLLWRGVALNTFDGTYWTNRGQRQRLLLVGSSPGNFDLRSLAGAFPGARVIAYRVLMEPVGTDVFFLAPTPQSLSGEYRAVGVDGSGSVFNADQQRHISGYYAVSRLPKLDPPSLRRAAGALPLEVAGFDLQLPRLDPRIGELAHRIADPFPAAYDKALAIERYLRGNYTYTLQQPNTRSRDPLAAFLFERKQGHCEYFASAMAVLLRSLGVPARIVNGFRGGEFNAVSGSYVIRARDAHSWVEAYFPGQGWVTWDPTPPGARPAPTGWGRALLYLDALREFWREWVINYDFSHQSTLATAATAGGQRISSRVRAWWWGQYAALLGSARQAQRLTSADPRRSGLALGWIVVLALLAGNRRRIVRAWRARSLLRSPERAPRAAAAVLYERMTRRLARRGFHKLPGQTAEEFVSAISEESLRRSVAAFTASYQRARFGDSAEDARVLPHLYETIFRR